MPTQPRPGSQRFLDKIDRYRWFIDCGRPFERHGVRSIRILTLTLTHERRDNLSADTDAFLVENDLPPARRRRGVPTVPRACTHRGQFLTLNRAGLGCRSSLLKGDPLSTAGNTYTNRSTRTRQRASLKHPKQSRYQVKCTQAVADLRRR
jgi:hypothetical protein